MWFLALRQLLARKKQSLLILLGIALGTTAFIIISGMMLGFQEYIIDQLVNNLAQINISAKQEFITEKQLTTPMFGKKTFVVWDVKPSGRRDNATIINPAGWYELLDSHAAVLGYSPQLKLEAIVKHQTAIANATVIGCNPLQQARVTNIENYMTEGQFNALKQGGNRIVLGAGLAEKIGALNGQTIWLATSTGYTLPFRIVGQFKLGIQAIDDSYIYTSLADAQKLNQTPGQISDIAVRLQDVAQAHDLANQWQKHAAEQVQSWDETNANVLSVFTVQNIIRYFMTMSILIVAGFGIYNVLNVLITQKRREIAILRALGFTPHDIFKLFLWQGLVLGGFGGALGILIGYLTCLYLQSLPLISKEIGRLNHMLISFDWQIYAGGFLLALIAAIISSVLPSRAAGKLTPIEVIRSGG